MTTTNKPSYIDHCHRAVVVGLGTTGYSVANYLASRDVKVGVVDSRSSPPMAAELNAALPRVETAFEAFTEPTAKRMIDEADLLVVNPGLSLDIGAIKEARQKGATVTGDIELFLQENNKDLIAITGSNGKSTVTTLVGAMCKAAGLEPFVAGNIGVPVLDALTHGLNFDVAVLELSSFQLERVNKVGARAATILNLSPDHMDRYDSFGDYALAKARILKGSKIAVLPAHDNGIAQITAASELLEFSLQEPLYPNQFGVKRVQGHRWLMHGDERLMRWSDVPLVGSHNVLNVLAAFALVSDLGLEPQSVTEAVRSFEGLAHRMQTVLEHDGVTWVNDSKATNVGAASTALTSIESPIIWLAGGDGKGADFSALAELETSNIKQLIAYGQDAQPLACAVQGKIDTMFADSLADAVVAAQALAQSGDVVLLSPACASFDMFENYEQRGIAFSELAHEVTNTVSQHGVEQ
ncbi:MAG: UDP-N-acetylmuramoyl-L-alanine--D-glutamate ligase [Pseudomonadota bacterium]